MRERNKKRGIDIDSLLDEYLIWDARKISKLLPPKKFIDVTITSPPYWNLKDYGVNSQIGFGQTYNDYIDDLEKVFRDIYAITTEKGSLWIISDTIKHRGEVKPLPFDITRRLKKIGWILQDIIIWNKDKSLPWSHQGKLRNIFEYITFYTKGRNFNYHLSPVREITKLKQWWIRYPERYSPEGKAPVRTWSIPIPRQGSWGNNWVRHFNPLPPKLVKRILLLTTNKGDVVFDPFCGSGAVLAQAHVMGRKFIGLDLNRKYKKMFQQRVLPAIRRFHKHVSQKDRKILKNKKIFSRLIRSLRKIKYPKEIVRLYKQEHGSVNLTAVLALKSSNVNSLDIVFLFPQRSRVLSNFLPQAIEICKHPPLSKYGIEATLTAFPINIVSRKWLKHRGLGLRTPIYLYASGRTYAWTERMTVEKWLKSNKNENQTKPFKRNYPTIISNINVKITTQFSFPSVEE